MHRIRKTNPYKWRIKEGKSASCFKMRYYARGTSGGMNAVELYVKAAQIVLKVDLIHSNHDNRVIDLNRIVPNLRQLLSCAVCCKLLTDPYVPHGSRCQHNVCRLCVRGSKKLRPACLHCKQFQNYKCYVENNHMRCLMLCYKSICERLLTSTVFSKLSKNKIKPIQNAQSNIPLPLKSVQEFVLEGAKYQDNSTPFTLDLYRSFEDQVNSSSTNLSITPYSTVITSLPNLLLPSSTPNNESSNASAFQYTLGNASQSAYQFYPMNKPRLTVQTGTNYHDSNSSLNQSGESNVHPHSNGQMIYVNGNAHNGLIIPVNTKVTPLTVSTTNNPSVNGYQAGSTSSADTIPSGSGNTQNVSRNQSKSSSEVDNSEHSEEFGSEHADKEHPTNSISEDSNLYAIEYSNDSKMKLVKRPSSTTPQKKVNESTVKTVNLCNCGTGYSTSNKNSCSNEECECYANGKSCIRCKCRGCRNPMRSAGAKKLPMITEMEQNDIDLFNDNDTILETIPTETVEYDSRTLPQNSKTINNHTRATQTLKEYNKFPEDSSNRHRRTEIITEINTTKTIIPGEFIEEMNVDDMDDPNQLIECDLMGNQSSASQQAMSTPTILKQESLIIQNAEGNYQLFNVYTSSGSNDSVPGGGEGEGETFMLPNDVHGVSLTQNGLEQILIPHEQQQNELPQIVSSPGGTKSFVASISQNNPKIISVQTIKASPAGSNTSFHPNLAIKSSNSTPQYQLPVYTLMKSSRSTPSRTPFYHGDSMKSTHSTPSGRTPYITPQYTNIFPFKTCVSAPHTVAYSPLIVSSPKSIKPEVFCDSSNEYMQYQNDVDSNAPPAPSPAAMVTVPTTMLSPEEFINSECIVNNEVTITTEEEIIVTSVMTEYIEETSQGIL